MQAPVRPRRSVLYMPGSNPRALEKGRQLPADALILDLEDAVAPDAKPQGRDAIREALAAKAAYGRRELVVRVNGLDTPWGHADLARHGGGGSGRHPAAQGRIRRRRPPRLRCAGRRRRARRPAGLVHDGDAARHPPRRGHRGPPAGGLLRHGHLRPDQGPARAAHARPRLPMLPSLGDLPPGRPRRRHRDRRRRPPRPRRRGGLRRRLPAGPRARLRRQDPDPPEADRPGQRRLRAVARRTWRRRAASSPPSRRPGPPGRAWRCSTASWSRTCTSPRQGGWSSWRRRSGALEKLFSDVASDVAHEQETRQGRRARPGFAETAPEEAP